MISFPTGALVDTATNLHETAKAIVAATDGMTVPKDVGLSTGAKVGIGLAGLALVALIVRSGRA